MRANSQKLSKIRTANFRNLHFQQALTRKAWETSTVRSLFRLLIPLAIISIALGGLLWLPNPTSAVDRESIIVELANLPPSVVAADQARREGRAFDWTAHDQAIRGGQDAFLAKL